MAEADLMDRILIVAPNWIGDAVLSLPVIDEAGRLWPNSEITVLARTAVARILLTRKPAVKILEYKGFEQQQSWPAR